MLDHAAQPPPKTRKHKVVLIPPLTDGFPLSVVHKHRYQSKTPSAFRFPFTSVSRVSQEKMMDGQNFISIRMKPTKYFHLLY